MGKIQHIWQLILGLAIKLASRTKTVPTLKRNLCKVTCVKQAIRSISSLC